jgi:hypothetical protein
MSGPPTVPILSTITFELVTPTLDGQPLDLTDPEFVISLLVKKGDDGTITEIPATMDLNLGIAKAFVDVGQFGTAQDEWFRRWRIQKTSDHLDIRSQNWQRFWVT